MAAKAGDEMASSKRVLVIDDDLVLGELVVAILSEAGYQVELASTAAEAHLALQAEGYDLILSDSLSSQPGIIWQWLNQLRAATSSPILIFSAHQAATFAGWQAGGFAGLLCKPFELDELEEAVDRHTSLADTAQRSITLAGMSTMLTLPLPYPLLTPCSKVPLPSSTDVAILPATTQQGGKRWK